MMFGEMRCARVVVLCGLLLVGGAMAADPVGTAIVYQGQLKDGGAPADGTYDFAFRLFDAESDGSQVGATQFVGDITVTNGLFTAEIDFGEGAFTSDTVWLEIGVRPGPSTNSYAALSPRQKVAAAPLALQSLRDANWEINSGNLFNSNGDRVGINETDPLVELHVTGSVNLGETFDDTQLSSENILLEAGQAWLGLYSDDIGNVGSGLVFGEYDADADQTTKWAIYNRATSNVGDLNITYGSDSNPTANPKFVQIKPNGDFGLSKSPAARMHVYYEDQLFDTPRIMRIESRQTPGVFDFHTAMDFSGSDIDGRNLSDGSGSSIQINRNTNGDVMMVRGGGKVGVGTVPIGNVHLHVENGNVTGLTESDLTSEDVLIESSNAWMGLYSDDEGGAGSGLVFGEVRNSGGESDNKWAIYRRTSDNVGDLVITYGDNVNPTSNEVMMQVLRDGTTKVKVLEITGADVAERFPCTEPVEPGQVVMIDAKNPGKLRLSSGAYNRHVAGVVSGAGDLPVGAILGNLVEGDKSPAIALSGRVWVQCDATDRAINPGDLMTTADRSGTAMAVADHSRAIGAIIGKAMTALPKGETGLVLVLVNLQ